MSGSPSSFLSNLSPYHPFGCPAYVLDARLQGGSKIPRWEPRSRIGVYLGHSPHNANNMALILNLATGYVSPQYLVVYDDNFPTVDCIQMERPPPNWPILCSTSRELVTDENFELPPNQYVQDSSPSSIHWLELHLDSEPTTVQAVFNDAPIMPHKGESPSSSQVLSNEGEHEGNATLLQNKGGSDGDVMVDPFSGLP